MKRRRCMLRFAAALAIDPKPFVDAVRRFSLSA
jgi:hypothetical protein